MTETPPPGERIRFACHDFSTGLGAFADRAFDHVVSGLSISYAESFDPVAGHWTTEQPTLSFGATEICQRGTDLLGLHAFGGDRHV